ncbi:MAG: lmo0937 family membrane protein [Terriglobales bacterium]
MRANYTAGTDILPGVREVVRSSDKVDKSSGNAFSETLYQSKEIIMLWTIFVVLLILWLLGFSLHIAGGLIHLLLVVALVILVINLVSGRRAVV